jgi:NADPH:quinone reductase-like Zn-dependent oxidoreductase
MSQYLISRYYIERATMKAIVIHSYGGPDVLNFEDLPDPVPGKGEVLVKTVASSVNPADFKMRSGAMKDLFPITFPAVLGLDVAGVVSAVGSGVTKFKPGDKVFAHASQCYASLVVVKEADLAHIPNGIQVEASAALPTVTLTGAQLAALVVSQSSRGSVLVAGAVGNVGRSAVFIAKQKGFTVYAGVLKRQKAEAEKIGADFVVALDDEEAVRNLKPLDGVADTIDGKTAELLLEKVKPGGVFASVLGPPANAAAHPKVTVKAMQVTPDATMLVQMAEALRDGKLSIPIGEQFPLSSANKAHADAEHGRGGKILLLA